MRRSTTIARTVRRRAPQQKKKQLNLFSRKSINANRRKAGLPDLDTKEHLLAYEDQQYATMTATTWSHSRVLTAVDSAYREGQKIRLLPGKLRMLFVQPTETTCQYRILLIKVFSKTTNTPQPQYVLTDTDETSNLSYMSPYTTMSGRTSDTQFKVLRDVTFVMDTFQYPTIKRKTLTVPGGNFEYDSDTANGTDAKGHLWLLVMTNGTPASASYTLNYSYQRRFYDMN